MKTLAIVLFSVTALVSAALIPNTLSLVPLLVVSAVRTVALVLALLFWVAAGRVDNWGFSRVLSSFAMIVGAAALAVDCLMIQMTRDDNIPAPMPIVYRTAAALLPVCFMASVLLASRRMFLIVSALAPLAGVIVMSTWKPLNAAYLAHLPKSKEQREHDELLARRMRELDSIPAAGRPELLIGFINPDELYEVRAKAQDRIEQTPDWIARLSALLDGENRLNALYVLTRRMGQLPDAVVERCWRAAVSAAKDQAELQKKGASPKEFDQ